MNPLEQVLSTQAALTKEAPKLNKLKQACTDMEAEFMKSMVTLMRKSAGEVHFGKNFGGDYYNGMMDDALSQTLAQKQPLGIAASMYGPMASKILNNTIRTQAGAAADVKEEPKSTEDMKH